MKLDGSVLGHFGLGSRSKNKNVQNVNLKENRIQRVYCSGSITSSHGVPLEFAVPTAHKYPKP